MLSPTEIAILIRFSASIAASLTQKGGAWAVKAMSKPGRQKALENCALVALAALLEEGVADDDRAVREQVSEAVEHFFRYPEPNVLLMDRLQGKPIDTAELAARFAEDAVPETLPQFDPEKGFAAFLEAFERQAIGEEALAGVIEVGHTVEGLRLKREEVAAEKQQAEALEELPEALESARRKGKQEERREAEESARRRYLTQLRTWLRILPLPALGGEEDEQITLEQVYVQMDTKTRVEEKGRGRRPQTLFEEGRALTALETAGREKRLMVLGDPGAGKSTFVRALLDRVAGAELGERGTELPAGLEAGLLPMLLGLRDVSSRLAGLELEDLAGDRREEALAAALLEEARAELGRRRVEAFREGLEAAWNEGRCLLVLDGLDEVPMELRRRVREAVAALARLQGMARMVVTCRVRSYHGEAELPGFTSHTLAPFNKEKIAEFCKAWYGARHALGWIDEATATAQGENLSQAALAPELRELAENPMLLTTMALVHQKEIGLPRERVKLFDKAVEVLLWRWQKRKVGEKLVPSVALAAALTDEPRLRQVLQHLAFEAHQSGGRKGQGATGMSRGKAVEILEAPEYLGSLGLAGEFLDYVDHRAGLLVGHGGAESRPEMYSFPHRTFQEYLAGRHLLTRGEMADELYEHAAEGDLWSVAAELGAEALLYVDGYPNLARRLAYDLCPEEPETTEQGQRALLWSAKVAARVGVESLRRDVEGPRKGPAYLARLIPRLRDLLGTGLPAQERAEAGRVLAALGDPRQEVLSVDAMELCWVPAGQFVMGSEEEGRHVIGSEKPEHVYDLRYGYWLARYPVTQGQYREFVDTGGYEHADYWVEAEAAGEWRGGQVKHWQGGDFEGEAHRYGERFDGANQAVVGVSWWEGLAFCRWLEERWRSRGWLGEGWGVGLPNEPEWEKAARGGKQVPLSVLRRRIDQSLGVRDDDVRLQTNSRPRRRYPWGDDPDSECMSFSETGIGSTSAVGCFPEGASPYGCDELSGNVWEWTRSCFEDYPYPADLKQRRKREDLSSEATRVLRGGAFGHGSPYVRCAVRFRDYPLARDRGLGFRVVVSPHSSLISEASGL